jgi:hypothetical protein
VIVGFPQCGIYRRGYNHVRIFRTWLPILLGARIFFLAYWRRKRRILADDPIAAGEHAALVAGAIVAEIAGLLKLVEDSIHAGAADPTTAAKLVDMDFPIVRKRQQEQY